MNLRDARSAERKDTHTVTPSEGVHVLRRWGWIGNNRLGRFRDD